jgi:hypothetical protein
MKKSMIKVVKYEELMDYLRYKMSNHHVLSEDYRMGYMDAIENLMQDLVEGRMTSHLFEGDESDSVIL